MEAPYPPNTVEPFLPATNSRPGPVFGSREGVFHPAFAGKYSFHINFSPLDESTASSQPTSISFLTNLSPECKPVSCMEAPNPLIAVEPFQPAFTSHSGPAFEFGGGVFQTSNTGKYACVMNHSLPELSTVYRFSSHLQATTQSATTASLTLDESRSSSSQLESIILHT